MSEWAKSEKSAEAYRTISEVADDLKLPQHVLRFWETRFTQVKPLKRAGGRRFYRPEDVALLRAIKTLLYGQGYTIKGVQRMLREQGPRGVVETCAPHGGGPILRPAPPHQDESDRMASVDPRSAGSADRSTSAPAPDARQPTQEVRSSARAAEAVGGPDARDLLDLMQAVAVDLSECRRLIAAVRTLRN